jgi:copper transport protein
LRRLVSRRLLATTCFGALACAILWPALALGHAAFVGSTPAPGVRLEASPSRLTLSFTEPLNRRLSTAKLVAVDGGQTQRVSVRPVGARRIELVPASPLQRGAYRIAWHTVSTEDGHALEGSYSFGVRAPAAGGVHSLEQSPLARAGWVRIALRGALYAFALVFVAALLLPLLTRRARWLVPDVLAASMPVARVRERQARVVAAVSWLTVLAAIGATLAEAADAAGTLTPARVADFLLANQAGAARVLVVVFFFGAAFWCQLRPRVAAGFAVLALGALAASGHASSASPRLPSILDDWLHLVSAAVWAGGIALVVAVWGPALRRIGQPARLAMAGEVLPRFGRVALPAFALAASTGLVSLLTQLGHLDALWQTAYGRVLMVKIALVGLAAALSATHALRLRPRLLSANPHPRERVERRHWRMLRVEPLVGGAAVAAVGVLVAFPLPPRQLGDADEARANPGAPCDPCPLARPAPDELAVADRAGRYLVAAWIRRRPDAIAGTIRAIDYQGRPATVPVRIVDAAMTACGAGCRRFRAPATVDAVTVAVAAAGRRDVVELPARWRADENARARRLLTAAQATMRGLRSVVEFEQVTSGPGSYAATEYALEAPDRLRYRTNARAESVVIGRRQWLRAPGSDWQRGEYGSGLSFSTRSWFRWTPYARAVRLLSVRREGARRVAELALMDEATPVWFRLTVDLASHRVISEHMAARAHFMRSVYSRFNEPVRIEPPRGARGG